MDVSKKLKKIIVLLLLGVGCMLFAQSTQTDDLNASAEQDEILLVDPDMEEYEEDEIILAKEGEDEIEIEDSLPPIERMPEIIKEVAIAYPPEVYKQGIEGVVLVNVIVNDSGTVDSVFVEKRLHPILDSNVVSAVRQFEFSPAMAAGEPVSVLIQYERSFTLKEVVEKVEQYVNFSGTIIEKGTKNPIADAMVVLQFIDTVDNEHLEVPFSVYLEKIGGFEGQYIEESRLVTLTDSLGQFRFLSLPPGKLIVRAPLPGYEEFEEEEFLAADDALEAKYYVSRVSYSDYEIVVYGKKEKKEVSRRKLTLNEVKKIPGSQGDAVKVVQALPGVARPTFGAPQIVVRGAGTSDSKFLLDGVEIPLLFHYGLKSTYNSDALESVDFYPGGFGTRYGNAIAGVIEITGRQPKKDRIHGYTDASFFDGSFFVEGPINEKVSFLGTARRSFIGDVIKLAAKKNTSGNLLTVAPTYWDYIFRTDYEIAKNQHSYMTLFGVKNKMELVSSEVRGGSDDVDDAKDAFNLELLFHMGIFGWQWKISDKMKNDFKYSFTYGENEISAFGFFKNENRYFLHSLRNQFTFKPTEKFTLNLGADVQLLPLDLILHLPAGENIIKKDTTKDWLFGDVGAYINFEWKPLENVQIIPGIRYDYFPELNYNGANYPEFWDYKNVENETRFSGEPSLRINGRYEFIKDHTLKGAIGNYNQSPEPMGQTIHKTWGTPNLAVTRAAQYVVGYEWQITDLIRAELEGYVNRQWKVPRAPTEEDLSSGRRDFFIADGKRKMMGLECMLRHDQGDHFFGWLAYSLSKSEYFDFNEKRYIIFSKDQTHNLIAVGNWRLPKNWEFGFKLQYTTGDPETPVIGETYNEQFHFYQRKTGPIHSERLEPTVQLDLRFDKKLVFKKWMISTYIDFFNIGYFLYKSPQFYVYNNADPFNEKLGKPNRRAVYQYSIPSIGIKGEF